MLWEILMVLLLILVLAFFLTQMIIPLWQDRPLFAMLRHTGVDDMEDEIKLKLEDERHLREVLDMKKELDQLSDENLREQLGVEDSNPAGKSCADRDDMAQTGKSAIKKTEDGI